MKLTKILNTSVDNWWQRIRNGDTFQIAGKDGSQFKTHAKVCYGIPLFKDGKGKILTPNDVAEAVLLYERF